MSATTVNKGPVNNYTFAAIMRRIAREQRLGAVSRLSGFFPFDSGSVSVATTSIDEANDEVFAFTFPADVPCYLFALQVQASDMDTDGSPTLVFDVNVQTAAGVNTTLINDTTIGQAGGYDELDANLGLMLSDVKGQKLGIKIVTQAATPAAGTLRFKGVVWLGDLPSIV